MTSRRRVHHEGTWGSGGAAPVILNLCSRWGSRLCAPFALRLGKDLPVPIRWRLAGPQSWRWYLWEKKVYCACQKSNRHSFVVQLLA